jgi:hypothetical protein
LKGRARGYKKPGVGQQLPENILSSTEDVIPLWTDDPVTTIRGLNGPEYIKPQPLKAIQIAELQEVRHNEEVELGFTEDQLTDFSPAVTKVLLAVKHITELRESIEKILNASGLTLKEYFTTDLDGNAIEPGPNDIADKEEWTDVNRGAVYYHKDGSKTGKFKLPDGTEQDSPTYPYEIPTLFKGIHLEDLRHPIQFGWREFWSGMSTEFLYRSNIDSPVHQVVITENDIGKYEIPDPPTVILFGTKKSTSITDTLPRASIIYPTDGGNIYVSDGQKAWLAQTDTLSFVQTEFDKHALYYFLTPPPSPPAYYLVKTGKSGCVTTIQTFTAEPCTDTDILKRNTNAKTLTLKIHTTSECSNNILFPHGVLGFNSCILQHKWLENSLETSPIPLKPTHIKINGYTAFKFLLKCMAVGISHLTTWGKDLHIEGGEGWNYIPSWLQSHYQVADETGKLIEPDSIDVPISSFFGFSFGLSDSIRGCLTLKRLDSNTLLYVNMSFGDNPILPNVTAPFNGQSFAVYPLPSSFETQSLSLVFRNPIEHDIAININDVLAVFSQLSPAFHYVNHKKYDEHHNIVKNLDGIPVEFVSITFTINGLHLSLQDFPSILYYTHEVLQRYSDYSIVGIADSSRVLQIYGEKNATITLDAVRIENNNRTVRGL